MDLLLIGALAAGAYAYNKSPEFKEKADAAGRSLKDLAVVATKEIKAAIDAKKNKDAE